MKSKTEHDLVDCINLQFNKGKKSIQTVNLNILTLWQAVSLSRGTDPNKGSIMNNWWLRMLEAPGNTANVCTSCYFQTT